MSARMSPGIVLALQWLTLLSMTDSSPLTPELLATWSDQELITEWSRTTWDSGDPRMKAMSDEIERRNLDF